MLLQIVFYLTLICHCDFERTIHYYRVTYKGYNRCAFRNCNKPNLVFPVHHGIIQFIVAATTFSMQAATGVVMKNPCRHIKIKRMSHL